MKKILVIILIICNVGACSNKNKVREIELSPSMNIASCSKYVHPTKSNAIGDYQACRINNDNNTIGTSKCMNKLGWERKTGKEMCYTQKNKKYFSKETVSTCLKKATINSKIDHDLVDKCLNEYEPSNDSIKVESVESVKINDTNL